MKLRWIVATFIIGGLSVHSSAAFGGMPEFSPLQDSHQAVNYFFDQQNLITLASATAAVAGAHQYDPSMREYFARQRRIGDLDRLGNEILGTGVPGFLTATGIWLWGNKYQKAYEVHAAQAQIETLVATGIVTFVLKGATKRDRPDNSDKYSFPSGHTSTMAASAMSLTEFYGWKIGVPMFALTALTAVSRMSEDRHWFSDTVAGASLGIYFGHAFSRLHLTKAGQVSGVNYRPPTIFPVLLPGEYRLVFAAFY